ncbi:MAG: ABC transporter ATP-binding protein [Myxococcota bacterium]
MSGLAIEVKGLHKSYGRVHAVAGLDLAVPEGSLFGLIGPNGAGKTTTFSLLAGFLRPDAGEIQVRGQVLRPGVPRVGHLIALPQDAALPGHQTAIASLVELGRLGGLDKQSATRRAEDALMRLGLADLAQKKVGALSHGQRRRVAIAQTLLGEREVILLDEPTAGLDPIVAAELRSLVKSLSGERTIILSSHNLLEVEAICDHAAIIARGTLVSSGTMESLRRSSNIVRVLLVAAPPEPAVVLEAVKKQAGVNDASFLPEDAKILALDVADAGADAAVNGVLGVLLGMGVGIKSVERGQSLEQRFIEDTRGAKASV